MGRSPLLAPSWASAGVWRWTAARTPPSGILGRGREPVNAGSIGTSLAASHDSAKTSGDWAMEARLRALSRQEVRELDARAADELALPTLILMENAGRGAAAWLTKLAGNAAPSPSSALPRVLILCGGGN